MPDVGQQVRSGRLLASTSIRPSIARNRHRQELRDAIARAGGRHPRVFRSIATGVDTASSDVDRLVDLAGLSSIWALVELAQELEQILGVRVDLVDDRGESAVLAGARAEAVPL